MATDTLELERRLRRLADPQSIKGRLCEEAADTLAAQREQIEALKREADDDNDLIDRLSKLLAETSIALKGPELPLHRHSYHDVPKVAAEIVLACHIGEELLRQEREKVESAERKLAECERDAIKIVARTVDLGNEGACILNAPCVFCGYNGANYWQPGTHAESCPFRHVGGDAARADHITGLDAAIDKARQDAKG